MTYRIELQRPLRTLAAVRTYATARRARAAFCELLRECRKDGMVVVIHHGREIRPRQLMDHAIQEDNTK